MDDGPLRFIHAFVAAWRMLPQEDRNQLLWRPLHPEFDYAAARHLTAFMYALDHMPPPDNGLIWRIDELIRKHNDEMRTLRDDISREMRGYT